MKTFCDVLDLWDEPSLLARDIGEKPNLIHKWRERNRIPAEKWKAVIKAAGRRGYPLDATVLTDIASRTSRRRKSAA